MSQTTTHRAYAPTGETPASLPSHLTPVQYARWRGVDPVLIHSRINGQTLASQVILGVVMIPLDAHWAPHTPRVKAPPIKPRQGQTPLTRDQRDRAKVHALQYLNAETGAIRARAFRKLFLQVGYWASNGGHDYQMLMMPVGRSISIKNKDAAIAAWSEA